MADEFAYRTTDQQTRLSNTDVIRIANAVVQHPRFDHLFTGLDDLGAWIDRAQRHYLNEIDRIGPTKARRRIQRVVNEVALIGSRADEAVNVHASL